MKTYKVAIIGAGPAGIACAIQLSRYGIIPMLFEKDLPGGLLKNANLVENYPGFPGGISGISLVRKMAKQLKMAAVPIIHEKVINIYHQTESYKIITNKNEYTFNILVIASGTQANEWKEFSITEKVSERVFNEVYPIRDVRDSKIAIVGAGDAAFDYALQLSVYNKVVIFSRTEKVKCLPLLWNRAKGVEQISYYAGHVLKSMIVDTSTSCLKLIFQTKNEMESHDADYIIFATGRRPALSFADPGLLTQFERLKKDGRLYLVGDIKNDLYRQAAIAAGDGIRAAMDIYFNESH